MTKEQAKQNLLALINACVKTGGIFDNSQTVAVMVDSVFALEQETAAQAPILSAVRERKSASEQIQERIDNN